MYDRLYVSSYKLSDEKEADLLNRTYSDGRYSTMVNLSKTVESDAAFEAEDRGVSEVVDPEVVPVRRRRAGDVNVNSSISTRVENNSEKSDSSTSDVNKTVTGGGYGSHTCTSSDTEVWNNSNITSTQRRTCAANDRGRKAGDREA